MVQRPATCVPLTWLFLFAIIPVLIQGVIAKKPLTESFGSPNIINEYAQQSNASLLWGPYRSNLYFGVRPKGIPNSFMAGLAWYNIDDFSGLAKIRHVCDQSDDMQGYGWEQYDPRTGGVQVFHDHREQKVELTTEFVKTSDGKSWAVRVKGKTMPGHEEALTTIVFYAGIEGINRGSVLKLADKSQYHLPEGIEGDIKLVGKSKELGPFNLLITKDGGSNAKPNRYPKKSKHPAGKGIRSDAARHVSLNVPDNNLWKAKDIFITLIQDSTGKIYEKYQDDATVPPWVICAIDTHSHKMVGNLHLVQRVFRGDFEFDIIYNAKGASEKIVSDSIQQRLNTSIETFEKKFQAAFPFQAPYDESEDTEKSYGKFAKELFSNLIGGVGYFQGTSLVDRSYSSAYNEDEENFWEAASEQLKEGVDNAKEEGPYELLTAVPSRPFFPRGFYWDEGFHLIPILEYDADLALEILKSWFALIDENGWIAREQILGPEARSKVPEQFQTQYPHYANPPTLMLLLSNILNKFQESQNELTDDKASNPLLHSHNRHKKSKGKKAQKASKGIVFEDEANINKILDNSETALDKDSIIMGNSHWKSKQLLKSYLKQIYPKLQLHYQWFRETQRGDIKEWDRKAFSTKEGYRWRGRTPDHCLTSGLDDYPRAKTPHTGELHVDLISWIGMMTRSMKQLAEFLGEDSDAEEYSEIETAIVHNIQDLHWDKSSGAYCDVTIDDFDENSFVCHKGYITLFPFLLRLIPPTKKNEDKLLSLLNLIYDPERLWTEYGVRSLSLSDEYYGEGENYWRGPIWININYMILDSLSYYYEVSKSEDVKELCQQIYKELRQNIVENVYEQWEKTGYAWEQYNPDDGHGQSIKHFLGWTSMTVMIMAMPKTLG